jgi:hypothetical protein
MYNPKHVLIHTFVQNLQNTYCQVFGQDGLPGPIRYLGQMAEMVLKILAQSDALYHDLEHTLLVVEVGQEILQAKRAIEGADAISPQDWLQFVTALLCHDIGYIKGACHRDDTTTGQYATGIHDGLVTLPAWATDAALTPYHVDRGQQFVAEQFADEPLIDVVQVQHIIELTRFPVPKDAAYQDTCGFAGLARAADLIGQLGDRCYLQKLPGLFHEFEETGANQRLGYCTPADVRAGFPCFYWNVVHPYVKDAIAYLSRTKSGQEIVIDLYANVLTVELTNGAEREPMTLSSPSGMTLLPVLRESQKTVEWAHQAFAMN